MSYIVLFCILSFLVALLCLIKTATTDGDPYRWGNASIVSGLLAVLFLIPILLVSWVASADETECINKGEAMNREVEFVRYSSFSWGCLTPSGDSKIPLDSIRMIEQAD